MADTHPLEPPADRRSMLRRTADLEDQFESALRGGQCPALDEFARRGAAAGLDEAELARLRTNLQHIARAYRSFEPGARIKQYVLQERVGSGAFGEVWKAADEKLQRPVALKLVRPDRPLADSALFLEEARAVAQVRHPNIVVVHDSGEEDGNVYIVTELVEGETLDKWLERRPPAERAAAELLKQVADAVHHAHQQGVIHSDLKPSNIIVKRDGQPHVLDFGLARREAGHSAVEVDGGTLLYMPPERLHGERHAANRQTDVYALGVILFQLLTGKLPFPGKTREEVERAKIELEPPTPQAAAPRVSRDLAAICLGCLQREPGRRYLTAAAVRDDLQRFLDDRFPAIRLERGRPQIPFVTYRERLVRWCRRNRWLAASAGLALAGLIVGIVSLALRYAEANRALEFNVAAIDEYFTRVSEERLLNEPGMQELRRDLLQRAQEYYRELLSHYRSRRVRDRLARAYFRLGRIFEAVGSPTEVEPCYQEALHIQEELVRASPADVGRRQALADTLNATGNFLRDQGQLEQALENYQAAAEQRQWLVQAAPDNREFALALANTIMNIGDATYERGLELMLRGEELGAADPAPAQALADQGRLLADEGLRLLLQAQTQREELRRHDPTDLRVGRDLARGYFNLGTKRILECPVAEKYVQQAQERFTAVRQETARQRDGRARKDDLDDLQALAQCALQRGSLQAEPALDAGTEVPPAAKQHFAEAHQILTRLARENPAVSAYQVHLAAVDTAIGFATRDPLARRGQFQQAVDRLVPLMDGRANEERYGDGLLLTLTELAHDPENPRRQEARQWLEAWEQYLQTALSERPSKVAQRQLQKVRAALDKGRTIGNAEAKSP